MANNVRFLDQVSVSAFGNDGGNSISSSYAETASFAHFATSASYAVSASHEITKEVSSSHADTASFAQSGNGIFSGSFSGSFEGNGSGLTSIPASGIIGLPVVSGTTDTIPIFTSANGIGDSVITYDSESFIADLPGGFFSIKQSGGDYVRIFPSQNLISTDGNFLTLQGSKGVTLTDGADTATFTGGALTLLGGGFDPADQTIIRKNGDIEVTPDGGGLMKIQFPSNGLAYTYSLPTATGTVALLNNSGSGLFEATGSFSGSFIGDGSGLTGISHPTSSISASYALTASYVETSQTASYVLNAISSSYALTASYAVSASHEIIKEVSSSYADTASFAQSGNGIFSGSFSGSYVGDGSGLTGVDPFPFSGSAVITGSLLVSGSSLPLEIIGSGSTIFSVQGSLGELFAIDDVLSGSLLTINDSGGNSQFEVFSDGRTLLGSESTLRSLYTTAIINATVAATSESIYSLSTSSYDGVFFDYTVSSASNARAGNIMSIWNGGNLVYTENTTTDIGSTIGVTFNVEISQSQAQLISLTDTAGWKIKTTIRSI